MLCIRIVFTNEEKEAADELDSFISDRDVEYTCECPENFSVFRFEAEDELLYDVCRHLCATVLKRKIENKVRRFINSSYNCFNSDECKIILNTVLNGEFISEIPGRLYIYLKINQSINPAGFFDFMCKDVWEYIMDSVSEEAERILALNDNSDFIEILRCFSGLSPDSTDRVELLADSTGLKIHSCYPHKGEVMTEYAMDDADVLSELIALNPRRIIVSDKEEFLKNDMSSVITAVFDGRIEYAK